MRIVCAVLTGVIRLSSVVSVHTNDPFTVAQRAVNELYVKPLHLSRAQLKITADAFPAQCSAAAITIRVLLPTKSGHREVLKIDATIIDGKLSFLGASGPALRSPTHSSADEVMNNTIEFLSQLNGWMAIDQTPRRGAKKGYIERQMRDPKPGADYEVDAKTIVFDETRGVPVLIGAPPSPTANNCGDESSRQNYDKESLRSRPIGVGITTAQVGVRSVSDKDLYIIVDSDSSGHGGGDHYGRGSG